MDIYNGQTVLVDENGVRKSGHAQLRNRPTNGRDNWRGDFRPDDGGPINTGSGVLEFDGGKTANVLIQDWTHPARMAIVIGNDDWPL
jgi:hypothetical protein